MPQTSKVIILLTALLLLAFKNIHGVSIEPNYVNAYTYTNLTISGASNVSSIEGAYVDYIKPIKNGVAVGLRPTKANGTVALRIDNRTYRLPIVDLCRFSINAANKTSRISVSVEVSQDLTGSCSGLSLYVNGSRLPSLSVDYTPNYSGVYQVLASNGVFYQKALIVVVPNVTVTGNVFGEVMRIVFTPPPRYGVLNIGPLSVAARNVVEIDTWSLGGGNYTMALAYSGGVARYNITIYRATPRVVLLHKPEYTYGEPIDITVRTYVGQREYKSKLRIAVNGSMTTAQSPLALRVPLLDAGTYQIYVEAIGDRNITSASASSTFRIVPAPVNLDVSINGTFSNPLIVEYGKVLILSANVKSTIQPAGELVVLFDGARKGAVIDTLGLTPGTHNLTVIFLPANRNFRQAAASTAIYIIPARPEVKVNKTFSITYGQGLSIPFQVTLFGRPINATLTVELASRQHTYSYVVPVVSGYGVLSIKNLPAGTYLATATLKEAPGLISVSTTFNIFVGSAYVEIRLNVPKRGVYGEFVPIEVSIQPQVPGRLTVSINTTTLFSGNASSYRGLWSPPRGGVFQVVARFVSYDPNYSDAESSTYIYIDRARCAVHFDVVGDAAGNGSLYVLRRYQVRVDTALPVNVYVNGSGAGRWLVFNTTGLYNVTAYFPGDASYYPCGESRLYAVVRNPSEVTLRSPRKTALIDVGYPVAIAVASPVGAGEGLVRIYKINKTYNTTEVEEVNINGNATIPLRFQKTGVYQIYAEFLGNSYLMPNRSNVVTVTVESSVFGIPLFLLSAYLISMGVGLGVAVATKKIFKRGL
ncbi:MAG: hypothetical protein ACPL3C_05490 [Pyrobaculum sp.]